MVLAHEFCQLIVDRRQAVPLGILSGLGAPPVVERRANAFAAELLLPLRGMVETVGWPWRTPDEDMIAGLMSKFGVGHTTCLERLVNRFGLPRGC